MKLLVQEPGVEATAVQLPAGSTAVDTAFYKDGQLALLLAPVQQRGAGAAGSSDGASLALLSLSELTFVSVPAQQQAADILQVRRLCRMIVECDITLSVLITEVHHTQCVENMQQLNCGS